jgi:hypothetical protein
MDSAPLAPAGTIYGPYRAAIVGTAAPLTGLATGYQAMPADWGGGLVPAGAAAVRRRRTSLAIDPDRRRRRGPPGPRRGPGPRRPLG